MLIGTARADNGWMMQARKPDQGKSFRSQSDGGVTRIVMCRQCVVLAITQTELWEAVTKPRRWDAARASPRHSRARRMSY